MVKADSTPSVVIVGGGFAGIGCTKELAKHTFPLYSLRDAKALRTRLFEVFEEADTNPKRIDQGALNIVIVGAGPTGVETAGAVADLVRDVLPKRFHDLPVGKTRIFLVDHGKVVLRAFSDKAHTYAAEQLQRNGVTLLLQTRADEVMKDRVVLSDGQQILSRCVVWAGGLQSPELAAQAGLPQGHGGRLQAQPDLRVKGHPRVYAVGDVAMLPGPEGEPLPQLGSVALQAGRWAAHNILADMEGRSPEPFSYRDKGIMAMIGRGSAIAEVGGHHHELHGHVGFAAWLGVHAWLMSGARQRVDAFVAWAWDFFFSSRSSSIIDDPDAAHIDWDEDDDLVRDEDV